jgi:abequosyltransferase
MAVLHQHPVLLPDRFFVANLDRQAERMDWFRRAVTTEAFFSFISGLIIRKAKWDSGVLPESFGKSCWGIAARYFGLMKTGLTVCYVPELWLDQRGDNDSFANRGVVNRYKIGIDGYHRLADYFFEHNSEEAFHIRRAIRNEFSIFSLLSAKFRCAKYPELEDRQLLDDLARMTYCDELLMNRLKIYIYFAMPYWLLVAFRSFYQPIKRVRRLFRNG